MYIIVSEKLVFLHKHQGFLFSISTFISLYPIKQNNAKYSILCFIFQILCVLYKGEIIFKLKIRNSSVTQIRQQGSIAAVAAW